MQAWLALLACAVLRAENGPAGTATVLSQVALPSGERTVIGTTPRRINAIGYAARQGVAYGLAEGDVVTITPGGAVRDLGPVPHPAWGPLVPPTAATVDGDRWYILDHHTLYTVDIDPDSPSYLETTGALALRPGHAVTGVHDLDLDPDSGLLYGVAAGYHTSIVVTIDPHSGRVTAPGPHLPPSTAYGAVSAGPDGALYVTANRVHGHSRLYRVPLDGTGDVRELAEGPPLAGSDATGCLARPQPPPEPPTTTPPPTTSSPPVPPPATTTRATSSTTTRPPTTTTTTTAPMTTTRPVGRPSPPGRTPQPEAAPPPTQPSEQQSATEVTPTERKRRWALAMLVLLIGAGAAARTLARR